MMEIDRPPESLNMSTSRIKPCRNQNEIGFKGVQEWQDDHSPSSLEVD